MVRVRAPDLPTHFPWLNSPPLSLQSLRGQVVLLDFWTYGCINCLHVLDDLRFLEAKYAEQLVVIGVHCGKFAQERSPASVYQAMQRYGITHPVVVDVDDWLWDRYAIRAWPTLVVIDPNGYIVATRSGEGQRAVLEAVIQPVLGEVAKPPMGVSSPVLVLPDDTLLKFPGAVWVDEASKQLFIVDTGHDRLVITTLAGQVQGLVGSGVAGYRDGSWAEAQFRAPQGLAWDAQRPCLYVADTGNHVIRQVDWQSRQVTTIAGTGEQSRVLSPHGGRAREVALNSPWGVVCLGEQLYVTLAGAHQLWQIDVQAGTAQTVLGTGAEFCVDGTADVAAFAQPSGITTDGQRLFIADSETSCIRVVVLSEPPTVQTLCGSGDLFGFGDRDGVGPTVCLQHCLGVAYAQGKVWIADTYNHKVKCLDVATGKCITPWAERQANQLAEPAGLAVTSQALYVADTNQHAIQVIDRESGTIRQLAIAAACTPEADCF